MGEVAMSSGGGGGGGGGTPELTPELLRKQDGTSVNDGADGVGGATTAGAGVVRWEKFLPRMVLRVLLVEADDSTRQIITALLRKCSYRVAAVSDGLKAWEVLKGRPHNIDLILTEVELPSISGFALLTLIMEHEICKTIPVIMMSAHDSVSTVYKCMLRGAADFLVKPVRKNELKNLWQHVWRRQASTSAGNGVQEESDVQPKVEATAENNATSNHSSGYMACVKLNREGIEKGSDAQSSCTKPDMEAEGPHMEQVKDLSNSQWTKSPSSDMKAQKFEHDKPTSQLKTNENEPEGSAMGNMQKDRSTQANDRTIGVRWERVTVVNPNHATGDPPREAIDLIGSFDSVPKSSYKSSLNYGATKVDHPSPVLDLSLRRSHPSSSVNQISDERHRLKQSDVSAFSRYVNKTQLSLPSGSTSISNQQKDCETNSDKQLSKNAMEYNSDNHSLPVGGSQPNMVCSQRQAEIQSQFPSPKRGVFPVPVPVPVRGLRLENQCASYGSVLPPIFCIQQGLSPMQSPGSSGNHEPASFQANPYYTSNPESRNETQELHNLMVDKNVGDETEKREGHKMETMEDRGHFSSATDHSASSGFCNGGTLSRINSIGSGSNGHINLVSDGNNTHRSMQREAALNKFRLKRKDRCYEKKVRYESRKKLAEQRPRVKGQFVRQVQTNNPSPSPMEADRECGNSSPG